MYVVVVLVVVIKPIVSHRGKYNTRSLYASPLIEIYHKSAKERSPFALPSSSVLSQFFTKVCDRSCTVSEIEFQSALELSTSLTNKCC